MSTLKRKYLSDFAVSLFSARFGFLTASQLVSNNKIKPETEEFLRTCNIYLICQRPAFSFSPTGFSYDGKKVKGNLQYKVNGKTKLKAFNLPFELCDGATSLKLSNYPHREIQTSTSKGKVIRTISASLFSMNGFFTGADFRNFKVSYIGQTKAENERTPIDRLRSHSTLQKILAEMQNLKPDDEAIIFIFEYCPYSIITVMDGSNSEAIKDQSDSKRFISVLENPLTEHQQTCLTEAGLIRYFQPEYNEKFKDKFPNAKQKLLDECYQLDFSALIVEMDTEELWFNLFSQTQPPNFHHTAKFDLIDPKKRKSFFAFGGKDGNQIKIPNVIPPSK